MSESTQQTTQQQHSQDARQKMSERRIDELFRKLDDLMPQLTEYVTVTRRHVAAQEAHNEQTRRWLTQQDERLRELEKYQAVLQSKLPDRVVSAVELDRERASIATQFDELNASVDNVRKQLARWGGVGLAVFTAVNLVGPTLLNALMAWMGG